MTVFLAQKWCELNRSVIKICHCTQFDPLESTHLIFHFNKELIDSPVRTTFLWIVVQHKCYAVGRHERNFSLNIALRVKMCGFQNYNYTTEWTNKKYEQKTRKKIFAMVTIWTEKMASGMAFLIDAVDCSVFCLRMCRLWFSFRCCVETRSIRLFLSLSFLSSSNCAWC